MKARLESGFVSAGNRYAGLRLGARRTLLGLLEEEAWRLVLRDAQLLDTAENGSPALEARLEALRHAARAGHPRHQPHRRRRRPPAASAAPAAFAAPPTPAAGAHVGATPWRGAAYRRKTRRSRSRRRRTAWRRAARAAGRGGRHGRDGTSRATSRAATSGTTCASSAARTAAAAAQPERRLRVPRTATPTCRARSTCTSRPRSSPPPPPSSPRRSGRSSAPSASTRRAKGFQAWHLSGTTTEERQKYRDGVLNCDRAAFVALADRLKTGSAPPSSAPPRPREGQRRPRLELSVTKLVSARKDRVCPRWCTIRVRISRYPIDTPPHRRDTRDHPRDRRQATEPGFRSGATTTCARNEYKPPRAPAPS